MFTTTRAELATPLFALEIDIEEERFSNLIVQVFEKVCSREDNDNLAPDREFAVDKGIIKIGRYQPFSREQEFRKKSSTDSGNVKTLETLKPRLLETLQ